MATDQKTKEFYKSWNKFTDVIYYEKLVGHLVQKALDLLTKIIDREKQ